jgi:hypothetical protein
MILPRVEPVKYSRFFLSLPSFLILASSTSLLIAPGLRTIQFLFFIET